jgi:hypothetical protein
VCNVRLWPLPTWDMMGCEACATLPRFHSHRKQGVPHVRPMRPACPQKTTVPSISQRRLTDDPRCEAESDRGSGLEVGTVQDFLVLSPEEIALSTPRPVGAVRVSQGAVAHPIGTSPAQLDELVAAFGALDGVPRQLQKRSELR